MSNELDRPENGPVRLPEVAKISDPFGIIQFGTDQRLLVGTDFIRNLRIIPNPGKEYDTSNGFSGRLLNLGNTPAVIAGQVEPGQYSVGKRSSIRGEGGTVFARIAYQDAASQEPGVLILDEDKLTRIIAGEEGGLAVFHGGELPDENALVVSDPHGEDKSASVIFFHPKDIENMGRDSVLGMRLFFEELNAELLRKGVSTDKALYRRISRLMPRPRKADEPGRYTITESIILANARLAQATGQQKYKDVLDEFLPGWNGGLKGRQRFPLGDVVRPLENPLTMNKLLNRFIINDQLPTGEIGSVDVKELEPGIKFDSIEGRDMYYKFHRELGDQFGKIANYEADPVVVGLMDQYVMEYFHL